MKKIFLPLLLLPLAVLNLSMQELPREYALLDASDYHLEAINDGITHLKTNQTSAIHWECFSEEEVVANCLLERPSEPVSMEGDDERNYFSAIQFVDKNHLFTFELEDGLSKESCDENIPKYNQILKDQKNFCILAAYWPEKWSEGDAPLQHRESYWVSYGLKSNAGEILAPIFQN